MPSQSVASLYGIYNADGGIVGEATYIAGRLVGKTHCELCDITHSPIRRKKSWDAFVAGLPVSLELLHRNELGGLLVAQEVGDLPDFPCVVALTSDGKVETALSADDLSTMNGDVDQFAQAINKYLATRQLTEGDSD